MPLERKTNHATTNASYRPCTDKLQVGEIHQMWKFQTGKTISQNLTTSDKNY